MHVHKEDGTHKITYMILIMQHAKRKTKVLSCETEKLRIDNCDERSYNKEGDISELKGAIFINDISIESPDFSLLHDII